MEIKINKEICEYHETLFFGLSASNAKRAERMANELLKSAYLCTGGGEK